MQICFSLQPIDYMVRNLFTPNNVTTLRSEKYDPNVMLRLSRLKVTNDLHIKQKSFLRPLYNS